MRILLILLLLFSVGCSPKSEKISPDIRDAYNATCKVQNLFGSGTGVLLDTGYIVTAAHVVDIDKNGVLDEIEATGNWVDFDSQVQSAEVIVFGKWREQDQLDIAILKIANPPPSKISLATHGDYDKYKYGEKIYTIGATNGDMMRVTDGRLDNLFKPEEAVDRATCDVYMGNSGGGIFHCDSNKLLGVVIQLEFDDIYLPFTILVPIPNEIVPLPGPYVPVRASAPGRHVFANWAEFVNANHIEYLAGINGYHDVVHKKVELSFWKLWSAVMLNFILLVVLYYHAKPFVRTILGKTMR